ncbi:MAG: hypothetical protein N3F66_08105 [Spirochaetes bacterium]|nr:hypothetical protein [Spirochaetota bacterium]
MKRLFYISLLAAVLLPAHLVFGATITGTPPSITISGYNFANLNNAVATEFANAMVQANADLAPYQDQEKLAIGFANANVYSTNAATQQGYQNYSLFAITTGVMIGAQAPTTNIDYYKSGKIEDDIKAKGDLYAGVAGSVALVNIGIHVGFLIPGLYINAKFGKFDSSWVYDNDDFSFNTFIVGGGVTYSIFDEAGIGLLRWRGLTVGTGLVYQTTDVTYRIKMDKIKQPFSNTEGSNTVTGNVVIDPSFDIALNMYTLSVPFEINTALQLLWILNLNLGAGIDLVKGNSDLVLKAAADATVEDIAVNGTPLPENQYQVTPGNLYVNGQTLDKKPKWARARVMTGIGFNFGPVKIDVPVIYYFDSGAAVGITAGFIW